jgi:hypothetical protein
VPSKNVPSDQWFVVTPQIYGVIYVYRSIEIVSNSGISAVNIVYVIGDPESLSVMAHFSSLGCGDRCD